jgi:hypothetical protein
MANWNLQTAIQDVRLNNFDEYVLEREPLDWCERYLS